MRLPLGAGSVGYLSPGTGVYGTGHGLKQLLSTIIFTTLSTTRIQLSMERIIINRILLKSKVVLFNRLILFLDNSWKIPIVSCKNGLFYDVSSIVHATHSSMKSTKKPPSFL